MGKIKSKAIKKNAKVLLEKGIEFSEDFENNKLMLKDSMPSKKIRNQMAGFLSRLKKQEKEDPNIKLRKIKKREEAKKNALRVRRKKF